MYAVTRTTRGNGLLGTVDSLFEQILQPPATAGAWAPAMDLVETPEAYILRADLPGVDPKAIDICVANGVLEIRGDRAAESPGKGEACHHCERRVGAFARAVTLPGHVDASRITAESRNGVLTVTLPKREEHRPRKITVEEK